MKTTGRIHESGGGIRTGEEGEMRGGVGGAVGGERGKEGWGRMGKDEWDAGTGTRKVSYEELTDRTVYDNNHNCE